MTAANHFIQNVRYQMQITMALTATEKRCFSFYTSHYIVIGTHTSWRNLNQLDQFPVLRTVNPRTTYIVHRSDLFFYEDTKKENK